VLLRHALRNAAVPVITVIGTGFALLISGVVVTESVFNLPGIGRLTVDAVLARDYPVIQARTATKPCERRIASSLALLATTGLTFDANTREK
jgi:ABC-type dipeptide/oligopeptide/nickel transport system permease component